MEKYTGMQKFNMPHRKVIKDSGCEIYSQQKTYLPEIEM